MASLSITLSTACQGPQAIITLVSISNPPGSPAGGVYSWTVINQVTGDDYGSDSVTAGAQAPVPNGDYTVRGYASYPNGSTAVTPPKTVSVSCSSGAALALDSLTHTDETVARGDGSLTVQASGGTAPLTLTLTGQPYALTAGQPRTVSGLAAGTYPVLVQDAAGHQVQGEVTIVAYRLNGCTDPAATNYSAAVTYEAGTCVYAPPPALPAFFAVPLLQTLRFVVRAGASPAPTGFDETLFCEQPRPGQQLRPLFYQPVLRGVDVVRVQVLTSYTSVSATISRHGGAAVAGPVALERVLKLEGPADPVAVTLSQDVATGLTRLVAAAGGALPASLLGATRLTLAGAATGTYRITQAVPGSVLRLDDSLLLNRPWVAVGAGAVTATWLLSGPGFNVWEMDLPLAGLADGYYQVRLTATAAGWADAVAISEPISLRGQQPDTVTVAYRNADNCFGMVFSTGITPRLRVPGTFFRQKSGGTSTAYRDSAGALTVLSSTAQRLVQLETYGLPAYLHEKLYLGCRLDYLVVNGVRCQTDQAYEVSDERSYPLTAGHIFLEQTPWLGAGNGDDSGLSDVPDNALALRGGGYLLLRGQ